jgi:arylsulfatase A-like enzyme
MEHVDILPTILKAIGVTATYGVQGVSQLEVIDGEKSSVRDSAITSYDVHDRGIVAKCLRTDRFKLVIFAGEDYGELFDLHCDPGEFNNLFFESDYREVRQQLMELLVQRLIQDQDPLPERVTHW